MKSRKQAIEIIPVRGMPEVRKNNDIAGLILAACRKSRLALQNRDIVVVTHKIVSKSENRIVELEKIIPSRFAIKAGAHIGKDPRQVELILSESRRLVKMVKGLIISETKQGFVCANAGVDQSNIEAGRAALLPIRPDFSAHRLRNSIKNLKGVDVAVIISDTFGRAWREGQVDVAIGIAGLDPFTDYRGRTDQYGYNLKASVICVADEIASAAELCMNKLDRVPVAIVRGYKYRPANVSSRLIARKPARDLFR